MPYKQDRYYQFGFEPYDFQALWQGWASPSVRAAESRALGDITQSPFFRVPRRQDPYWLDRRQSLQWPQFRVPRRQDPYWLHKHQGPRGIGDITNLSRSEKQLAIGAAAAVAGLIAIRALRKKKR